MSSQKVSVHLASPALRGDPKRVLRRYTSVLKRGAIFVLSAGLSLIAVLPASSQGSGATAAPPLWTYTVTSSRDGRVYNGTAIGRSPFARGKSVTNVPTVIVPLIVTAGGVTFDPTGPLPASASGCYPASWAGKTPLQLTLESPVFTTPASDWIISGQDVGKGQYHGTFQRAEFWSLVQGTSYRTALNPVTVLPAQTVPASATAGYALSTSGCATSPDRVTLGSVHGGYAWENWLAGTLIPSLQSGGSIHPGQFVFFLLYNVTFSDGFGYHSFYGSQTYGVSFFNGSDCCYPDIKSISHEIGDWMGDPYTNNPAPAFLSTEPPVACQNDLESGDASHTLLLPPLAMPNGATYRLQELTYFSWFMGGPSLGAGGQYSSNGTYSTDAGPVCH